MRILLLSDIHANIVALDKVLAEADGSYDNIWCLGDVVGYGPAPNECVERLRGLQVESLAGNHDWAVLNKLSVEDFNTNARRAVEWTQSVLRDDNFDWLDTLPDRETRPDDDLTLVHGSPRHPIWEYILTPSTATENLSYFDTRVCFYGHTHVPMLFYREEEDKRVTPEYPAPGTPLSLTDYSKCLLNPGSVGQPRDRDPRAAYAILDLESHTYTLHRVDYDIRQTQKAMEKVHLPHPLIERLAHGV